MNYRTPFVKIETQSTHIQNEILVCEMQLCYNKEIMKNEIEVKFLAIDKDSIRAKLIDINFELNAPEHLMCRKTFDLPSLDGKKKWGRVRQEHNGITMSVKETRGSGIKDTYEIELIVNDFELACSFLETCGIKVKAFQESKRELWSRDGVAVTIDTWPGLNPFIEIEGCSESIVKNVSLELGFDFQNAVFGSIDRVYEVELGISSDDIIQLPEITFADPPKK